MTIGNRIAQLRKGKGFTQEYIAQQLGVSRQAVSKWEQDQASPDTKNLIALSELLGASIEYIATGKTENSNRPNQKLKTVREINRKISEGNKQLVVGIILLVLTAFLGVLGLVPGIVLIILGITNLSSAARMSNDLKEEEKREREEGGT